MWERLSLLQVNRPYLPLGIALLLTLGAGLIASRLQVRTGFEALLPEGRRSVQELKRVAEKTSGVSTLFVVLEGGKDTDTASLRRAADALVVELEKLGPPWVGAAESGAHEAVRFLRPRAGLFVPKDKLEKLRDEFDGRFWARFRHAVRLARNAPTLPPIDVAAILGDLGLDAAAEQRYPDGYYQSPDGKVVVVAIRSQVASTDLDRGTEALRRIRKVIDDARLTRFHPQIRYGLAGDLQTGISEYRSIVADLTEVGILGAAMLVTVVFLYYLRFRTLLAMLLTIAMGVVWTFGATRLLIGHLNVATGFLFTIIAGNGINFGIIYMARFLEVRRRGGTLLEGVATAHQETWIPTLTAGAAAAAAYGSLLLTEFKGFHDFGTIGAIGMALCWIATYLALPAILAVIERFSPIEDPATEACRTGPVARLRRLAQGGIAYGAPFAAVVARAPRLITVGGVAVAAVGLLAMVRYARSDPMEYDLNKLRVDARARSEEIRLTRLADRITGYVGSDGMAILLRRADQVGPLKAALEARRDAAPPGRRPFQAVHTLQDLVPPDQAEKIPVLLSLRARLSAAYQLGGFEPPEWERIKTLLPPKDLRPFGIADLPEGLARMFTETDGTRGRIVFISPTVGEKIDDARYLFRWADSFRRTVLPGGEVVHGSGRAVIYADIWAAVLSDVPPAVLFSLGATLLVILVAFRASRFSVAVMGALLVGVAWMVGLLVLMGVKLNFLNFIALPITFGIGVDYAVNVVQRYRREGPGGVLVAIQQTGGAVILCSLTTTLGYLALVSSMNHAVRSLGLAAVLGEVSCLLAAVLVLPAALLWLDQRRARRAPAAANLSPPG